MLMAASCTNHGYYAPEIRELLVCDAMRYGLDPPELPLMPCGNCGLQCGKPIARPQGGHQKPQL